MTWRCATRILTAAPSNRLPISASWLRQANEYPLANFAISKSETALPWFTGTHFSVSSGAGSLALFAVSVQIGVIVVDYMNQLRQRGLPQEEVALEGAQLRLRPIMMTMLVATLGLLPAALSRQISSNSQRPFAIVIVGGLIAALAISIFLLPTLYVMFARPHDKFTGS